MWSFKPNLFIKKPNTKQKKLHSPTKNQHYLDARTNEEHSWWDQPSPDNIKWGKLICSDDACHVRTQCGTASAPGIAAESRPSCKGTHEKRDPHSTLGTPCKTDTPKQSYRWLLTDTCALLQIGSKVEEEKQQQQQTSQAKVSWLGAPGSGLTYSTMFENYRHTQQTRLLSSTEGEKE